MNADISDQPKNFVRKIKYFLWWSAGVVPSVLEKCPTNHGFYTAVGVIMLAIAIVASCSFAFFLSQTFAILPILALFGGIAWGFGLIFNLDRLLLTSFRKGETGKAAVIQRFILTIALALIIGEPLLMYFFSNEIALEMTRRGQTVTTDARRAAVERFQGEIDSLRADNTEIQNRLDTLKNERDSKEQAVIGEIEGKVGSRRRGYGEAARQKETAFKEADAKYREYKTEADRLLNQTGARLNEIQTAIEREVKTVTDANSRAVGVLARHEALFAIVRRDLGAALIYIPLFTGLMFLETLPLTIKVFGGKTVYDDALEAEEARQKAEIKARAKSEEDEIARSSERRKAIELRLTEAVVKGEINGLQDENDIRSAAILQTEALQAIEKASFERQAKLLENTGFSGSLNIEIIGRDDLNITLHLPENAQKTLSLQTIGGDIRRIADAAGEKSPLAKAFSSARREIAANLPLLAQLEKDAKLLLQFETLGES